MTAKEPPMTRKYYLRWLVLVAILISGVTIPAIFLLNQPLYGMCPNRQFIVSHVYLPDHDQVISENSQDFFHRPYSQMGEVIAKDKSLFIAFATYGPSGRTIEGIAMSFPNGKQYLVGLSLSGFVIDRDISILYPLENSIQRGDIVDLTIYFPNNQLCLWSGVVG